MRLSTSVLALLAASTALMACKPEDEPPPIGARLDSPAGVAVLGSSHLLVSNANFQLQYSGGSLAAIDLSLVDESRRFHEVDDVVASAVPLPSFSGPVEVDPSGTLALVSNRLSDGEGRTSDDQVFLVDVSNPADLALSGALEVGRDPYDVLAVRLPPAGPGRPVRDRAFVANSSEGTIALLSLTPGTRCAGGEEAPCVEDAVPPPRASNAELIDVGPPAELTFSGPGLAPEITRNEQWVVTFIEAPGVCPVPGAPGIPAGYWRVEGSVSGVLDEHACTGLLYVGDNLRVTFTIARAQDPSGAVVGAPPSEGDSFVFETFEGDLDTRSFLDLDRSLPGGTIFGRGVGQLIHDPFRGRVYATSRRTNFVYAFDVETLRYLGAFALISNTGAFDSRGLALSPDGEMLYVVNRSPNSLLFLDPDALDAQLEMQIVVDGIVDSVPLDLGGSEMAVTPDGRYAFVSAFDADRVDVLDLQTRTFVRAIPTSDGPFALDMSPDGTRVYVATYFDHAIEVIDSDPASPTFGEILTTIGNPDFDPDR